MQLQLNTNRSAARCSRRDQRTIPITRSSRITRSSNLITSGGRAGRTLIILGALFLLAAAPRVGWATLDNVVYDGTTSTNPCSDGCCLEYTLTIHDATSELDIYLINNGSGTDCFDQTCWSSQGDATQTFTSSDLGPPNHNWDFKITASALDRMETGPFPYIFNVYICGTYDCMKNYETWNWQSSDASAGLTTPLYLQLCNTPPSCGSGCSYIAVNYDGTGLVNCGILVCFYNQSGADVTSFTLNFDPAVSWSNPCGSGGPDGFSPFCIPQTGYNASFVETPGSWSVSDDGMGNFTVSGGTAENCGSPVCLFIPWCKSNATGEYHEQDEQITLIDPPNTGCSADNSTISVAMKQLDGSPVQADSGGQNYPNPLGASSGFNTTIPFVTSAGGVASITISDSKGVKVLTDDEEILGAGGHFFYFSAKDLPSGTYYYTIEFPQGVVIANKTMIVVK